MATSTLSPSKLQAAGHYRQTWEVVADAGTTLEDLLRPSFWLHVAAKLRRMSVINVLSEDETWFAELIVLASGIGFAKVKMLRFVEFYEAEEAATEETAAFTTEVKWSGPHAKHRVIRKEDGTVLKEGFANKVDAESWQRQHEAMIKRAA